MTTQTDKPNLSTEHQQTGDAARPNDRLDRDQSNGEGAADDQPEGETIPRKSSLLPD
jgi:hypothetical protein